MHAPIGLGMSAVEVESRCLADACASVKKQAFYMNKAIEGDNLKDALRYAALLLGELRTGDLQPQRYFELYMQARLPGRCYGRPADSAVAWPGRAGSPRTRA